MCPTIVLSLLYSESLVNSSVKVFSLQYGGPSTHIFRTSSLCMFIIYRKKEIGLLKIFFGPKVIPNYMSS